MLVYYVVISDPFVFVFLSFLLLFLGQYSPFPALGTITVPLKWTPFAVQSETRSERFNLLQETHCSVNEVNTCPTDQRTCMHIITATSHHNIRSRKTRQTINKRVITRSVIVPPQRAQHFRSLILLQPSCKSMLWRRPKLSHKTEGNGLCEFCCFPIDGCTGSSHM